MLRSGLFFDAVALPYELLTRNPVWERHCAQMAGELPAGARRVLDLGCGPGNSTVHLPAGSIGGDYALSMLHRARRRAPAMPLLCLDAGALPLKSGSLDAVTFHSVLYLLPDQPAALREVVRVLRPGGRAVLLEPREAPGATIRGLLRALRSPRWAVTAALWRSMSRAYGRFTSDALWKDLEKPGLQVVKIEEALGGLGWMAVAEKSSGRAP
jgi:ubiquinone/menaquinone biosynthesis C-methylase UbiE